MFSKLYNNFLSRLAYGKRYIEPFEYFIIYYFSLQTFPNFFARIVLKMRLLERHVQIHENAM